MSHNQIAQFAPILERHFAVSWDWLDSNRAPWDGMQMISESKRHNPPHRDVDLHNRDTIHLYGNNDWVWSYMYDDTLHN